MQVRSFAELLARFLLAFIFITLGLSKFSFAGIYIPQMRGAGFPAAGLLWYSAAVVETLGGFAIFLGLRERTAALLLFVYLIPVTIIFHVMRYQSTDTLKNVAIMGALLIVASLGGGRFRLGSAIATDSNETLRARTG